MAGGVGSISYAVAGAAFGAVLILILASWRGRIQGALLAAAVLSSTLWALFIAYHFDRLGPNYLAVNLLELIRNSAWLGFLAGLLTLRSGARRNTNAAVRWLVRGTTAICVALLGATASLQWLPVPYREAAFVSDTLGRVVLAIIGIVLVEQVYRSAREEDRWGIKFMCFGAGGMFAYDFYLYANALLLKSIDSDVFAARGFANALVAALVAVSAARNPGWSLDIAISRKVIFHSATLVGAGVYLLLMAAAGYYIRFFGGSWGGVLQASFLFGALVLLLLMLVSGTLRARSKVLLSKHFFSHRFDYREEWLRFTKLLSEGEPGVRLRERSIEAIAGLVDSPGGALWLELGAKSFERAAQWNFPAIDGRLDATNPLVRFLEQTKWVVDVGEVKIRPQKYDGIVLPDWLLNAPRAWLIAPLVLHEKLLGFVVLAQSRGDNSLNWEVSDLLKTAGRQAASYLAQLEAAQALLVARQFESFNQMSAFVVHDLKNLVSQLSLLLSNAKKHRGNPAFFDDMVGTVENSVEKMQRLLTQLRSGSPSPGGLSIIDLEGLLRRVVSSREGSVPIPNLQIMNKGLQLRCDGERLERVVGHMVQNAIEATPGHGRVTVRLRLDTESALIEVEDTGKGMSAEFIRENLFHPFETTKSSGMGIGAFESKEYVQELGGKIEVESEVSVGTTFRIWLPLSKPQSAELTATTVET